jgi:hypothetical protein
MHRSLWSGFLIALTISPASAVQSRTLDVLAQRPDGTVISGNWSGYAVTGEAGAVTAVSGSWIVPAASCDDARRRNSGASFWVGIDGYNSATVEQTGTDSDCADGAGRYYAWYEFFPKAGKTISSIAVSPGDVMSASVTYDGAEFTATIEDETTGQIFSIAKTVPKAKRNSAEWIAEDNSRRFTDFGSVAFGQDNTGVSATCTAALDGATNPIGAFAKIHTIDMENKKTGRVLALPSALSDDGTSFSVAWH